MAPAIKASEPEEVVPSPHHLPQLPAQHRHFPFQLAILLQHVPRERLHPLLLRLQAGRRAGWGRAC